MPLDPITAESFAMIDRELAELGLSFPQDRHALIRRAIHSTADFELAGLLRFHPQAINAGVRALRDGAQIVADVRMVAVGIDQRRLQSLGGQLLCLIADPAVQSAAAAGGGTRSALGMRAALLLAGQGALVVVGNAPTALREVLQLIGEGLVAPSLVIGAPVGFVDARESKEALMACDRPPWISVAGRKGGSPVAVALVNALLHLALPELDDQEVRP